MILFRYSTLTRVIYFGESMDYYKSAPTGRSGLPVSPSDCSAIGLYILIGRSVSRSDIMSATVPVKRRACVACTAAKAKCTPQAADLCQRCARLGKACTYLDLPQTKRKHKVAPR